MTPHLPLQIAGLCVDLGGRRVLDGVDLSVPSGSVTVVAGPNGCGKSTLVRAALGLLPATGVIRLGGGLLHDLDHRARARRVAYVPQRSRLTMPVPVASVVAMGRFSAGNRDADAGLLARLDLTHLAERPFTALSAGEQQRVLIARALAAQAPALVLDEPTAALDVGHALDVLRLVRELATAGLAVLVVLHDLAQVRQVADQVLLLVGGRVLACGAPADVLTAAHLRCAFGVEPDTASAVGFRRAS